MAGIGHGIRWTPPEDVWVPSGKRARVEANLAALRALDELRTSGESPTAEQQQTLAAWSSWGAVPEVFESQREGWDDLHTQVRNMLTAEQFDAARATTLNAHYSDPGVARAMWQALSSAGEVEGPVLEPGSGSGTFMHYAPDTARMVGVELDPITAEVAAHLAPHAQVRNESFAATHFEDEAATFVAAIGNVPFGGFSLVDPTDNPLGLSIHNHFLAKSMRHVTPGGYGIMLSSSYTMDGTRSTARSYISRHADLVGAVRLPSGAMSRVAGTDVVTDVLVFRRREPGTATTTPAWLAASHEIGRDADGRAVLTNDYWLANPEHVLGTMSVGQGIHGSATVKVAGPTDARMIEALTAQLTGIIDAARSEARFAPTAPSADLDLRPGLLRRNEELAATVPGHVRPSGTGFEAWTGQGWQAMKVPRTRAVETRALLGLRDATSAVVASQRDPSTSSEAREAARGRLNASYDSYISKYGPINRFEWSPQRPVTQRKKDSVAASATRAWRAGLPDDMTGAERQAAEPPQELVDEWVADIEPAEPTKRYPHLAPLRDDPAFGLVLALERYDEDTGRAAKQPIFRQDIVATPPQRAAAESPADALAISLDETRSVDVARIADLLGVDEAAALASLSDLTFTDHDSGELVPAFTYLAGDVRAKHGEVTRLVDEGRGDLRRNANELEAVLPEWVSLDDLTVRPGVLWIDANTLHQFAEHTFGATMHVTYNQADAKWEMEDKPGKGLIDDVVAMQYGTSKKSVADLWLAALNNQAVSVSRTVERDDGSKTSVRDPEATRAAREKVATISAAFAEWLPTDPDRTQRLEQVYNARFNGYVAPSYHEQGQALKLPGLAAHIEPHTYQRAAVARALNEPTTMLDHVVGAGKTGTMIMAAMELRRTGVARKPWVVVPNHLVEQTAAEWAAWYPSSSVMTIPTGVTPTQRRMYAAKSAVGDWDAVIVPATVFERIGVDQERAERWSAQRIAEIRSQITDGSTTGKVKQVERQVKTIEAGFESYLNSKDNGLSFEETGCDYVFIDEAHHYKNLARASDYAELACTPGAQRATDLDFKLRALREAKADVAQRAGMDTTHYVPAVAMFATGTPVANQLSELWVMQRYLQPEVLDSLGLDSVDAWARQFTQATTKMELGPDGSTWRLKDRVSTLINAPELISLVGRYTDRIGRDQITVRLPQVQGEGRQIVSRPASPQVEEFIVDLAERANNLPSDPSEDNLLKITHEGRMVALDPRTLGMEGDLDGGRVGQVADKIAAIHEDHAQRTYTDATGATAPTPGPLQLVFADRSTPKGDGTFSAYEALAGELVSRGMDRSRIAFIHDATDDDSRAELFARCRTGAVNVLIGSTDKMGTGVNVQDRAVALHHMDCPWRPADVEQREGRIIRQGNQNPEVQVLSYVTEGTFDAVMWQIVARKAEFIAQTKAASGHRHLHDTEDEMTVSAAAASAIATGDPRIVQRAELVEQVRSLETLRSAHYRQAAEARRAVATARGRISSDSEDVDRLAALLPQRTAQGGYVTPNGRRAAEPVDQGRMLIGTVSGEASRLKAGQIVPIGTYRGLEVSARAWRDLQNKWAFSLELAGAGLMATYPTGTPNDWSPSGIVTRLDNLVERIEDERDTLQDRVTKATDALPRLEEAAAMTFAREDDLLTAQHELDAIDAELAMDADADAITAVDHGQTVTGQDLRHVLDNLDHRNRLDASYRQTLGDLLCEGDVIRGVEGARTTLYVVAEREELEDRGRVSMRALIRPHDAPSAEPTALMNNREQRIELISRPLGQFDPIQRWALDNSKQLVAMSSVHQVDRSDAATVFRVSEDRLVIGRLVQWDGPNYRPKAITVELGEHEVDTQAGQPGEHVTFDAADLQMWQLAERVGPTLHDPAVATGLPGDYLTAPFDHATQSLPARSAVVGASFGQIVLPTGESSSLSPRVLHEHEALTPGIDLTGDQLSEFGVDQRCTVGQLRRGDVMPAKEIDPKAAIARPVRILNTFGAGHSERIELTYAPANGGEEVDLTRAADVEVGLESRRLGALSEMEIRRYLDPAASTASLTDLPDGQLLFLPATRHHFADGDGLYVLESRDLTTTGYRRNTQEEQFTLQPANGEGRTLSTPDTEVLVYPDGATVPQDVPRADLAVVAEARSASPVEPAPAPTPPVPALDSAESPSRAPAQAMTLG